MFCQFCGTVLEETARFCKSCAMPTGEDPPPLSAPPAVPGVRIRVVGATPTIRWTVVSIVAFGAAIAGIEALNLLWSNTQITRYQVSQAHNFAFAASVVASVTAGVLIKKVGVKKGLLIAALSWSLANIGYLITQNFTTFTASRVLCKVGAAVCLPLGIYVFSRWLPKAEQSIAVGILHAALIVGSLFSFHLLQPIASRIGWRGALVLSGLLGVIWAAAWWASFQEPEKHPLLTREEFDLIQKNRSGGASFEEASLSDLLARKELWGLVIATLIVNVSIVFIAQRFNWKLSDELGLSDFTVSRFLNLGLPAAKILGAIVGGLVSGHLLKAGKSLDAARKMPLWLGAGLATFALLMNNSSSYGVVFAGYAISSFGLWFLLTAMYTLPLDLFESNRTAAAVGFMVAAAQIPPWLFSYFWNKSDFLRQMVYHDPGKVIAVMSLLPLAGVAILMLSMLAAKQAGSREEKRFFVRM